VVVSLYVIQSIYQQQLWWSSVPIPFAWHYTRSWARHFPGASPSSWERAGFACSEQ